MLIRYFLPSPALRGYVRLLQLAHFTFSETASVPAKPYWPRPEQCLTFYPRETETVEYPADGNRVSKPRSALIGQPTVLTKRHIGRDFLFFQVIFQPGALYRLIGISSQEFTDAFVDAEAVFPKEIRLVNERLSSTDSYTDMISIVESFLYDLTQKAHRKQNRFDRISHLMLQPTSVDQLAEEACLCQRQFYRKFVERVGISPKLYERITRFDYAMKQKNAQPSKDWLSIALDCGYYDYQHLVKDFKDFTQLSPNVFFEQERQAPERTFGLSEPG
jgi:AraC-like DNA-binding protein